MAYHRLSPEQLTALANGVGGPDVMAELNESRVSLHLMLLKNLADHWPGDRDPLHAAVRLLARVQQQAPLIYADMIGDPMVGAWLTRVNSTMRPGGAEALHLGGVAAAAALHAGLAADLIVHADEGRLVLPTFGEARLGAPATGPVAVSVNHVLTDGSGAEAKVSPARRLRARHQGQTIDVRLEDVNPYRGAYHAPPSERLSDDEAEIWQGLFTRAWQLLVQWLPDWAAEIGQGLRAIVPLRDLGDGSSRSGTARESVGAMGMSLPASPADLAITLVHEFHHSKLSGLIELIPLYRPGGAERHRVPWKTEPRPTAGLIQGVYAFLGVADTWHHLSGVPELTDLARRQFIDIRAQVGVGLVALEGSTELTEPGRHFTAGMRARFDQLLAVPPG